MSIFNEDEQDDLDSYFRNIQPHIEYAPACIDTFIEAYSQVYNNDDVGGNVHVVLDDWNLNISVINCSIKDLDSKDTRIPVIQAERDVLDMLKRMTIVERYYALHVASRAYSYAKLATRQQVKRIDRQEARRKAGWKQHD